jgi:hypothetical protein
MQPKGKNSAQPSFSYRHVCRLGPELAIMSGAHPNSKDPRLLFFTSDLPVTCPLCVFVRFRLAARRAGVKLRTALVVVMLNITAVAWTQQAPPERLYENHNQIDYKTITVRGVTGKARETSLEVPNVSLGIFTEKDQRLVMTTRSSADGTFAFAVVPPGLYRLVATFDGFCAANVPIRLVRHGRAGRTVDLHMKPAGIDTCSYGTQASKPR